MLHSMPFAPFLAFPLYIDSIPLTPLHDYDEPYRV